MSVPGVYRECAVRIPWAYPMWTAASAAVLIQMFKCEGHEACEFSARVGEGREVVLEGLLSGKLLQNVE